MRFAPPPVEAVCLFAFCWIIAKLEIEIEGGHGWAENLPTWRWAPAWLLRLSNGKPVTGYHVYFTAALLSGLHLPLLFTGWEPAVEARLLSFYFLIVFVWDFQWFVWNPAWGARRFFREHVWWFPKRLAGFPLEYYFAACASFAATALLAPADVGAWLQRAAVLALLSAASVAAQALGSSR